MEIPVWIVSVLSSVGAIGIALLIPFVRDAVGRFVAGFVQHHFDERIEKLKSELRQSEERVSADIKANEHRVKALTATRHLMYGG